MVTVKHRKFCCQMVQKCKKILTEKSSRLQKQNDAQFKSCIRFYDQDFVLQNCMLSKTHKKTELRPYAGYKCCINKSADARHKTSEFLSLLISTPNKNHRTNANSY